MDTLHLYEELDCLTSKSLDEIATPADIERLEELIKMSSSMRKRYALLVTQESLLHWETGEVTDFVEDSKSDKKIINFPIFASAAAAIVALLSAWGLSKQFLQDTNSSQIALDNVESNKLAGKTVIAQKGNASDPTAENFPLPFTTEAEVLPAALNKSVVFSAIELLESEKRFDDGAIISVEDNFVVWDRTDHLSVPAENGILPLEGAGMIKLSGMVVNVDTQTAEVQETLQVVDVRHLPPESASTIDAEICLNKGATAYPQTTEFELSVEVLKGLEGEDKFSLGSSTNSLIADADQETWENLTSSFVVPEGADFLVVSLTARIEGPESLLPNPSGNYADSFRVNLSTVVH